MPPQGPPLELSLLIGLLDNTFGQLIAGTGISNDARRSNYLSKAVAAFVLQQTGRPLSTPEKVPGCIVLMEVRTTASTPFCAARKLSGWVSSTK